MPANLAKYLTPLGVNQTDIDTIYGSITIARSETDEIRAGVIKGVSGSTLAYIRGVGDLRSVNTEIIDSL